MAEIRTRPGKYQRRFAKNMFELMDAAGETYNQLREATGIPQTSLSEYMRCVRPIPIEKAARNRLRADPLLGGRPDPLRSVLRCARP